MINWYFDITPAARRQLCDAALARYLPRSIEAPVKVATIMDKTPRQHYEDYCRRIREFGLAPGTYEEWLWHNRNAPDVKGRDPRIGEVVQVPFVTAMTIVARITKFGRDWYELEATLISRIVTHKLVEAI